MKKAFFLACFSVAFLSSCENGGSGLFGNGGLLDDLMNDFKGRLQGDNLQLRSGFMPEGEGSANFIEEVDMNSYIISGGSLMFTVTSREELDTLYIQIEGEEGYYALDADECFNQEESETGSYVYNPSIEVTQELADAENLRITVSGISKSGEVAVPPPPKTVKTKDVGAGNLQISLAWDNDDDLDLYVYTPSGEEIAYYQKVVGNGELDLDAHAACSNNLGVRNENIFFEAPLVDGEYEVQVKVYQQCRDGSKSNGATYTVRAVYNGESIINEQGSFAPADDNNFKKIIGTITVANGVVL
jgi:hypothetical protein